MLYYEGLSCPVCQTPFSSDDDMVVCPQCGLPHHRECWLKENRCAMESLHGTELQWNKETATNKSESTQTIPEQQTTHYTPPLQEYTPAYTPSSVAENYHQTQYVDGVSVTDLTAVVGNNTLYYIPRFLRLSQKQSGGWNWAAFLLGQWWLIYRKQYFWGILLFVFQTVLDLLAVFMWKDVPANATMMEITEIVLQNPLSIPWAIAYYGYLFTRIFLGFRGNRLYLRHCQSKIRRLREKTPDLSAAELASYGGTAMGVVAVFYMLSYFLSLASTYFTM